MRIPHSSSMQRDLGVTMTPMIDVVFLLLIFFVCTANFQMPETILPTHLLATGTAAVELPPELQEVDLERVVVAVTQADDRTTLSINDQNCPSIQKLGELLGALAAIDRHLPIVLDIGGQVPLGTAIDIYDLSRLAGFEKIQFAAKFQP